MTLPRTPTGAVRVRTLRPLSGHWSGDIIDLDHSSAAWLIEHREVELAPPGVEPTTGGRRFLRPELAEPGSPAPSPARSRRSA